jgi:hypothetical protein
MTRDYIESAYVSHYHVIATIEIRKRSVELVDAYSRGLHKRAPEVERTMLPVVILPVDEEETRFLVDTGRDVLRKREVIHRRARQRGADPLLE